MPDNDSRIALRPMLDLMIAALAAEDIGQCCQDILPHILTLLEADSGFVWVSDPRLPAEQFVLSGFSEEMIATIEATRWDWFDQMADAANGQPLLVEVIDASVTLVPLLVDERILGMIGLTMQESEASETVWPRLPAMLGNVFDCLATKASQERRLLHFDTFLEVSSLLAKPVGLSESLEIVLFTSMKAVSAEAASVLLLDEAKESFSFFHVEGTAKPLLGETTFKATEGIAGSVLQTLEAEIVSDTASDARFYGRIDAKTGFETRNLIAVPLLAGNEPIGVLEVLNRADDEAFTADDRLILVSVAEQIAYAIRNAVVFDRVIDAYCRRRKGADSCSECPHPLESWAPCAEYRERSA
jgi:GAF domain-containing protein